MTQYDKTIRRASKGLPWDRVVSSVHEWRQLIREMIARREELNAVDAERNALIDLVESQRAELQAFRAAGAASMETHNAKET